ncbi:MAG: FtsQ-type POTRA domain-containing protein, partial [Desulfobacterales bacterium]|nr:FtsQ-type POTRA domain-containing protein [Desulfobacterales bacterium]
MVRKQGRKNYYKNSRARIREHIIRRCISIIKVLLLVAGMAATSLFFILAHDALTQSACFEARTITVEGNQRLSRKEILKRAGLELNDNILSVNLGTVRHRLLANPWVAAAEVERELPDAIHIRLKERVPIAVLDLNRSALLPSGARRTGVAGRRYYLDADGEIFKAVEAPDQTGLPVVTGLRLSDIDLSDTWRPGLFRDVMEVLHLSRLYGTLLPIHSFDRLHADRELGLIIFASEDGLAVKLGSGDYKSKYERLRDMLSCLRREDQSLNIKCIDLNELDRVVVRSSGGVSLLG